MDIFFALIVLAVLVALMATKRNHRYIKILPSRFPDPFIRDPETRMLTAVPITLARVKRSKELN